jgi:GNAT superfamily N-acetyltransferase
MKISLPAISFTTNSGTASEDFRAAMEIYMASFPPGERHPLGVIEARMNNGSYLLYTGRQGQEVVFMALTWQLKDTDFLLLDYMATRADCRGRNIGGSFLQWMKQQLQATGKYFILEAEDPGFGENGDERSRRIKFYRRNGARLIEGLRYILPPLQGDTPTDMQLLIFPEYGDNIDAALVIELVILIYRELYGRPANDPYLHAVLTNPAGRFRLS